MERKALIMGNWKMYKGPTEAREFVKELLKEIGHPEAEVGVAPPFVSLFPVWEVIKGSFIKLCAQDVFWEKEGPYTGEISPSMLKEVGCSYVIIGHSERRIYFGETDQMVNKKLKAVIREGLKGIVCVGENLQEREEEKTLEVITRQLNGALEGLTEEEMKQVVIAYEPVWAIGTGKNATSPQIEEVHTKIREFVARRFNPILASSLRILYGGSVKPDNIDEIMAIPDVDGVLVGGASLKVDSFVRIVNFRRKG
jgi:triosephosphate isomerase